MRTATFLLLPFLVALAAAAKSKDCFCGQGNTPEIETRIINGAYVSPHAYPWLVYLKYQDKPYCGGSLINDRFILTAAHCVFGLNQERIVAVLGADALKDDKDLSLKAKDVAIHPDYIRYSSYDQNDLALIELEKPVTMSEKILPICLTKAGVDYTNVNAIVAGWGMTENKTVASKLMEAHIRVTSDEVCRKSQIGRKFVQEYNLCAYGYKQDSCQGDSGSAIFMESSPLQYTQIGVVSWGEGCASPKVPSAYVRLGNYLDWIMKVTDKAVYCQHPN
ncbi:PREDICTED: venom protease-like [Nicrophorus vespilloides]|uniref:Venom protease-like n=1 Tax=Nicrophorus vespilloides TaxID=110193 RepID=A0ABM1MFJ7_NICVS|nr:PREDICTED: venom protease-like [Nicrophorus vespilloides]